MTTGIPANALVVRNARVLTLISNTRTPAAPARGRDMNELGVLERADVVIDRDSGRIAAVTPPGKFTTRSSAPADQLDADGRVLMPGFVDAHTHACWAGSRVSEWEQKCAGRSYQEIMAAGGGILSTVRAVRASDDAALERTLLNHLHTMLAHGTTTAEVKTGYGLDAATETRMLRAILAARTHFPGTIAAAALLGHAIDPAHPGGPDAFVRDTIARTLPAILAEWHRIDSAAAPTIDAYCETGSWSVEQCVRLFEAARTLNPSVRLRVHADQFNALGMVREAVRLRAVSVDHLEASEPADLVALARSDTFAVALPCCGFHLDGRYADARTLVDHGARLCIATNFNPGSAPCPSMAMAVALAVRHCGLTPNEAITASTLNPAAMLGFTDRGIIAPGARADLILLRHRDERALAYEFGANPVEAVFAAGRAVHPIA